jgi:hypothetical protein
VRGLTHAPQALTTVAPRLSSHSNPGEPVKVNVGVASLVGPDGPPVIAGGDGGTAVWSSM